MLSLKKKRTYIQLSIGMIPVFMSVAFIINKSLALLPIIAVAMFLIIRFVPAFRHRESLWMFLMVAITSTPMNIFFIYKLLQEDLLIFDFAIIKVFFVGLLFCVLFSLEEIAFGVVTRIIWKRQYKMNL